jgi:hypothetical protein
MLVTGADAGDPMMISTETFSPNEMIVTGDGKGGTGGIGEVDAGGVGVTGDGESG